MIEIGQYFWFLRVLSVKICQKFGFTMSKFAKKGQILVIQVLSGRNWSIFWVWNVLSIKICQKFGFLISNLPKFDFLNV